MEDFAIDIVIGTGGYACWPTVKAAAEMGIPTALHESNAVPGVAIKALASKVDRIYVNFEKASEAFPDSSKVLHVGNPLMSQFAKIDKEDARRKIGIPDSCKYVLLSYGGSLGAEKVNDAMLKFMKNTLSHHPEIYHIHATGSSSYASVKERFDAEGLNELFNVELDEYIYDMPQRMAAADVVVCRAGAMTVSELSLPEKCAVFIPSPNVTNNHQYKNAKVLSDDGAALLFTESEIDDKFESKLAHLLSSDGDSERAEMEKQIAKFAVPDANRRIYEDIIKLIDKK